MSSSPPSDISSRTGPDIGTDRPDPADLPDTAVGFTDEEPQRYAVPSGPAGSETSAPLQSAPGTNPSPRERIASALERVRPWSAWSLRAKLVASMLALFTILSLITGAATVIALNRQLTGQVDEQLSSSVKQILAGGPLPSFTVDDENPRRPGGPGDEGLIAFLPAQPTVLFPNPVGAATSVHQGRLNLTSAQLQLLARSGLGTNASDVNLGGDLGRYRVVAAYTTLRAREQPITDGTPGVLVVGLPTTPNEHTVQRMLLFVTSSVAVGVILVALLGTWLVRRNLEPLRRVAGTAMRVSRMPLDSGQVALAERVPAPDTDVRTEVGQVGAAFNEMLDHVAEALNARHQSEQRVRQFVADASHELRTPLASIKGYAEISRREPEPMPDSVGHAMGRIESEAGRMGSLVEDLLLLARLDEGRPLESEPVDVSMLVVNAVSDAHAAAPDRQWNLDLPPEPVEVRGDQARLHQVVTNLLANARTHTPPGTRVTTSVHRQDGWVRIAVHDNGPGVPATLQPNVFERFARGDDSRNRANGSTGLGLSIVAAVTRAHGGRVELSSSPGDTTFEVVLPAE